MVIDKIYKSNGELRYYIVDNRVVRPGTQEAVEVEALCNQENVEVKSNLTVDDIEYLKFKESREVLVSSIVVEYEGNTYQGDETSQDRMARAILGMNESDTIKWKTEDNNSVVLSKADLQEILRLAGQRQTEIWFKE